MEPRSGVKAREGPRRSSLQGSWALNPRAAGFPTSTSAETEDGAPSPGPGALHRASMAWPPYTTTSPPAAPGRLHVSRGWQAGVGPQRASVRPQRPLCGVGLMVLETVQRGNLPTATGPQPRPGVLPEAGKPTRHSSWDGPCGLAGGTGLDPAYPAAPAGSAMAAVRPRTPGTRGRPHVLGRPAGLSTVLTGKGREQRHPSQGFIFSSVACICPPGTGTIL